jgi:hypothetical protein
MFDRLRKYFESYRKPLSASRGALVKDAAYVGVRTGKFLDATFHASDALANAAFKTFGPASPRLINATDRVAQNPLTAKAVSWATEGGPLTKAGKLGWKIGTAADQKWQLSNKAEKFLTRALPLKGAGRPTVSVPTRKLMGAPALKAAIPQSVRPSPAMRNLRLSLPKLRAPIHRPMVPTFHTPKLHLNRALTAAVAARTSAQRSAHFKLSLPKFARPMPMHRPAFSPMHSSPAMRGFRR